MTNDQIPMTNASQSNWSLVLGHWSSSHHATRADRHHVGHPPYPGVTGVRRVTDMMTVGTKRVM